MRNEKRKPAGMLGNQRRFIQWIHFLKPGILTKWLLGNNLVFFQAHFRSRSHGKPNFTEIQTVFLK